MISVIMPTHNRPPMLHVTLLSVFSQNFDDYEFIVADASPDRYFEKECESLFDTFPNLSPYRNRMSKMKIVYPECDPKCPDAVKTEGMKHARQDDDMYVFLDHDDFLGNGILSYVRLATTQYPDTEQVSADYTSICYNAGTVFTNTSTYGYGDVCGSSDTIWVDNMFFRFDEPQNIYRSVHPWKSAICPKIISKKTVRGRRFVFMKDTGVMDDVLWPVMTHSLRETSVHAVGYVYVAYVDGYFTNSCNSDIKASDTTDRYAKICETYSEMLDEIGYVKQRNICLI